MKILHVIAGLAARTGGPANALVDTCVGLRDAGVRSTIFTTDLVSTASVGGRRSIDPTELPPGAGELDVCVFHARPPRRLAASPELERALASRVREYDLVHIYSLFLLPQWYGFRHAARAGLPHVVSLNGALDPYLRERGRYRKRIADIAWQRRMLRSAACAVMASSREEEMARDVVPDSVPRVIIPQPVDLAPFASLPRGELFRERCLGGHSGQIILNVGRLAAVKGLDLLVAAFARIAPEVPDCKLVLAGPDDEGLADSLRRMASKLDVTERVVFPGMLTGELKLSAFSAATIWALPSHAENFGVAVVEALAAGLPTVISSSVGIARDVVAADAGLAVASEPQSLATVFRRLLNDPGERARLGERGRAFVRRYDRAVVGHQLAAAYAQILARDERQALPQGATR